MAIFASHSLSLQAGSEFPVFTGAHAHRGYRYLDIAVKQLKSEFANDISVGFFEPIADWVMPMVVLHSSSFHQIFDEVSRETGIPYLCVYNPACNTMTLGEACSCLIIDGGSYYRNRFINTFIYFVLATNSSALNLIPSFYDDSELLRVMRSDDTEQLTPLGHLICVRENLNSFLDCLAPSRVLGNSLEPRLWRQYTIGIILVSHNERASESQAREHISRMSRLMNMTHFTPAFWYTKESDSFFGGAVSDEYVQPEESDGEIRFAVREFLQMSLYGSPTVRPCLCASGHVSVVDVFHDTRHDTLFPGRIA